MGLRARSDRRCENKSRDLVRHGDLLCKATNETAEIDIYVISAYRPEFTMESKREKKVVAMSSCVTRLRHTGERTNKESKMSKQKITTYLVQRQRRAGCRA